MTHSSQVAKSAYLADESLLSPSSTLDVTLGTSGPPSSFVLNFRPTSGWSDALILGQNSTVNLALKYKVLPQNQKCP